MWESLDLRYWAALAGTAIWVGMRDAEKEPIRRRLAKTVASGLLAERLKQEGLAYNARHPGSDFPDGPHFEVERA